MTSRIFTWSPTVNRQAMRWFSAPVDRSIAFQRVFRRRRGSRRAPRRAAFGDRKTVELEVLRYEAGPGQPDLTLFGLLSDVPRERDPGGTPVPMLLPGITDGGIFAKLGIQTYGFLPMQLPPGLAWPICCICDEASVDAPDTLDVRV